MPDNHPNGSIWLVNGHGEEVLDWWFLGFFMAMFAFWQLCHGILEGAFHEMYISGSTSIFSLSSCIGFASGLLGMALYYWVFVSGLNELIEKIAMLTRERLINPSGDGNGKKDTALLELKKGRMSPDLLRNP